MDSHRGGSKISVRPEDVRQQYVECPHCLKEYNEGPNMPRILPCLHAICDSCLESVAARGIVKCPTCDFKHTVPNGDINRFQQDQTREYLINHLKCQRRNPDIACEECGVKGKRAAARCSECGQFLCPDCSDAHRRTKVTKKHKVVGLDDLREAPLEDFQFKQFCSVTGHEEQPYVFYCKSRSCDKPVCPVCAVRDHPKDKGHDIKDIEEVYFEYKRTVEGLVSDVRHRFLSAQDTANAIESTMKRLDHKVDNLAEQIDETFENCIKALERRRTELKDRLHAKLKSKKVRLDKQLDAMTFLMNNMEDANEFANSMSNYSTLPEFLFFKDTVIARLNDLRDEEFDVIPHDNDEVQFKLDNTGDTFNKFARTMGSIWTTSAYLPNTHVETVDTVINREDTALNITLFDSEGHQQTEGGVNLKVDIVDPNGKTSDATIEDLTSSDGYYKAMYHGHVRGKHRATVYLFATPMPQDHVFRVMSPLPAERLALGMHAEKEIMREAMKTATPSEMSEDLSPITDFMIGDIVCPGFVFDATSCNKLVEILEEGKTMKSKPIKGRVPKTNRGEPGRLQIYRGAMASRPMQKAGLYYFEVGVVYKIHRLIRQDILFEVGLSKLETIDKHQTVDCHPYAWSVNARGCHVCGKVCLQAWHNGQLLSHSALSPRTTSPPGTFVRLYFGFLLDTEKRHWIVVDVKNKKLIFVFKNLVVSEMSEPLWPVFGVYSPESVSVALTLKSGRQIDSIPEEALYNLTA